jgi:hypothetical protein
MGGDFASVSSASGPSFCRNPKMATLLEGRSIVLE